MYGLSIGVSNIDETLPRPVYALLSGLNAATVGVIALAAVELSGKAITDRLTRVVVFLTAAAGLMYNALWYFPVLMILSGAATLVFDLRWLHRPVAKIAHVFSCLKRLLQPSRSSARGRRLSEEDTTAVPADGSGERGHELQEQNPQVQTKSDLPVSEPEAGALGNTAAMTSSSASATENEPRVIPRELRLDFSWKTGTAIIACFLLSFIAAMVLRSVLPPPIPLLYR